VGTLATVNGRLVVVQGIDAFEGGSAYHPEEAADVQVIPPKPSSPCVEP